MIYIFGDSYGDPNSEPLDTYQLWCEMFDEPVSNYCRGSTGPQYSLRKFNDVRKNINDKDKIVFIMSDKNRLNFPFIREVDHTSTVVTIFEDMNVSLNKNEEYLRTYNYDINLIFSMFKEEINLLPLFVVLYLNFMASILKCKIIIIPAFSSLKYKDIDVFNLNSKSFRILNIDLYKISNEEFTDGKCHEQIEHYRRCHLSSCNHVILFNHISNFFFDTKLPEQFQKNLYEPKNNDVIERFIYQ